MESVLGLIHDSVLGDGGHTAENQTNLIFRQTAVQRDLFLGNGAAGGAQGIVGGGADDAVAKFQIAQSEGLKYSIHGRASFEFRFLTLYDIEKL
jgi:hypothetical protein